MTTIARPQPARHPLRVLHVEDSEDDSTLILRELQRAGFDTRCERVDTQAAFKRSLQGNDWDVIISDYSLPHYNGLTALADTKETGKDIPFILVSGTVGEIGAVNAMKAGAHDYVLKGALSRLPQAIEREVREAVAREAQRKMSQQLAISERMASAGMLAAGVSHEINSPLAVVVSNLDFIAAVLQQSPLARDLASLEEPLRDAREAAGRIRTIVRDMKHFARPQDEERRAVDVRSVIESSIRMASNEIRHRAELITEFGEVPMVDSNEARLEQVLLNLLVNAAQSMAEGRASQNQLRVVTKTDAGRVIIEVHDTGSGIPKDVMPRIFDPFFTTKQVGVGTGLGLSICHRMITSLGGEITVESEVGKGSLFRISLPAATGKVRVSTTMPKVTTAPVRRSKLLVVDDEIALGRALGRGLSSHHDVTLLTSGKEALARLVSGERFDAILSDLMMPEVTGMQIYGELSRIAPDQAKRMIFLTGGAFTAGAREFLDRIGNRTIEKPFDIPTILAAISATISAPNSA